MDNQDILDGLKSICQCKVIKKKVFLRHIKVGINTVEGLKEATGAGVGECAGKRCTPRIIDLLNDQ